MRPFVTGLLLSSGVFDASGETLFIDYSPQPKPENLLRHTLCILDPHAQVNIKPAQATGHHVLAYLSVVEVAKGSPNEAAARKRGVPMVGENSAWSSSLLDVSTQAWRDFILEDGAAAAFAKGFDGLFLDTVDSIQRLAAGDEAKLERCRSAVVAAIQAFRQRWPDKKLILNRGFDLLPRVKAALNGILVESVYHGFDPATKRYQSVTADGSRWLEARIREAQTLGLRVYAVDYLPLRQRGRAVAAWQRLRDLGCTPFITTHELRGEVLIQDHDE